jgi:hypothetical protein
LLVVAGTAVSSGATSADPTEQYDPRTTYGETGMLDMPSARMAPDGELSATMALLNGTQRYNFGFQFLPWFQGSFRYSRIADVRGQEALFDRSFGMKARLSQEDESWPEISMGIRDLLGTGVYGSEYFVATKRVGDFDVTAGLGWGRLASVDTFPNPFGLIIPSFKDRPTFAGGNGGTVNFGQFFHGPSMGLFGGAIWHTPLDQLDFIAEYSSDRYVEEVAGGQFKVRIPVNVGLSYRLFDIVTMSAGWYYGSDYGVTLTLNGDPTVPMAAEHIGPDVPMPAIRTPQQQISALTQLIVRDHPSDRIAAGAPWVKLPSTPPDPDTFEVASALMSVETGVHGVDISGRTLLIDARLRQTPDSQCQRYASVVKIIAPRLETVAISDPDDSSGKVTICSIIRRTSFRETASGDDASGTDAPATTADPAEVEAKIRADVAAQSIRIEALSVEPRMVWIYFNNRHYFSQTEAAGRIARVLMADAPPGVEIFHIVSVRDGNDLRDFQIARSALERATIAFGSASELTDAVTIDPAPLSNPVLERAQDDSYPRFHWKFGPGLREGFFDPNQPIQLMILGAVNASVELTPELTFEGRGEANIYNTLDLSTLSNSVLPHVRSDLVLYEKEGINGIANLDAVYRTRISRDMFFEAKAGYLEDMYAGGGLQFLWRPEGERIAIGADLYQVWKRNFDRLFGVQQYRILTGHVSLYYQSPWYGLNFNIHVGRYLAGDYGATIEVVRQFSTGVEVGAFATFTNVPFSKFGEGSFDKGIIVNVPLEWALPFFTQSSYDLLLRSLIRDGGQRLDNDDSLYEETQSNSYGQILDHMDDVIAP